MEEWPSGCECADLDNALRKPGESMRTILWMLFGCFACLAAIAQTKDKEPRLPTTDEIQLVVSQADRAIDQYDGTIALEATLLSSQQNKSALEKDRQVVELTRRLLASLKKNLDAFHGLGGFLLFSSLDDATRNSSLCSASAFSEISTGLLSDKGLDKAKAFELMHIAQACQDASLQLYTISENIHALMVRELEWQEMMSGRALEALNTCTTMLNQMKKSTSDKQ